MTKTMLDDAEVMHGLGPVPLLQRQSAVESRWTRTVPTSRESARKAFRKVRFCPHQKWMPPIKTVSVAAPPQGGGSKGQQQHSRPLS